MEKNTVDGLLLKSSLIGHAELTMFPAMGSSGGKELLTSFCLEGENTENSIIEKIEEEHTEEEEEGGEAEEEGVDEYDYGDKLEEQEIYSCLLVSTFNTYSCYCLKTKLWLNCKDKIAKTLVFETSSFNFTKEGFVEFEVFFASPEVYIKILLLFLKYEIYVQPKVLICPI
jgi:hypothetical protein